MNSSEKFLTAEDIRNIAYSFQQSRILLTAVELKIFTVIDKHMLTSKEVASKLNIDEKATDRLMNALCAMGLLKKIHGKFYNSESASQFLVEGKPEFMGGLFHTNELWKTWSTLTEAVKKGTSVYKRNLENSHWTNSFIAAMHYRALKEAKIVSYMIELKNVKRMLDVGGGSGAFTMKFVESNPDMKAVIFDLPEVIPLTRKYVEEFLYKNNISFIEGNYLTDDIGNNFDLIFLSAIVHSNSFDENILLIRKCADALNKNGQIIIKDWIMDEDRTKPAGGALFAVNMLVGTKNGDTYTESEMRDWLNNAGISKIERKDTSFGFSLLIGKKD
ncbi:MAG: methyltransferase [Melioribacter sp.]|uniref:methyltransferase n=1 Tax=Rosettibacter primus TaxID=3111523 RepID=UPI00247D45C9|nr:methyltransferase [Melioribacter sp.]